MGFAPLYPSYKLLAAYNLIRLPKLLAVPI